MSFLLSRVFILNLCVYPSFFIFVARVFESQHQIFTMANKDVSCSWKKTRIWMRSWQDVLVRHISESMTFLILMTTTVNPCRSGRFTPHQTRKNVGKKRKTQNTLLYERKFRKKLMITSECREPTLKDSIENKKIQVLKACLKIQRKEKVAEKEKEIKTLEKWSYHKKEFAREKKTNKWK